MIGKGIMFRWKSSSIKSCKMLLLSCCLAWEKKFPTAAVLLMPYIILFTYNMPESFRLVSIWSAWTVRAGPTRQALLPPDPQKTFNRLYSPSPTFWYFYSSEWFRSYCCWYKKRTRFFLLQIEVLMNLSINIYTPNSILKKNSYNKHWQTKNWISERVGPHRFSMAEPLIFEHVRLLPARR